MASTSDVCQITSNNLDFAFVGEVPDSYVWPEDVHNHSVVVVDNPISTIDMSMQDAPTLIAQACESVGVFQVTAHGVPAHVLSLIELESQRLFSLPLEQKLKAIRSSSGDLSGYGSAPASARFPKLLWSEGFTIIGSPLQPAQKLWPLEYHHFCEVVEEYKNEMGKLGRRLMSLLLASLSLTEEDTSFLGFEGDPQVLQLNSYPPCPNPSQTMGMMAHTDSSLFTILHQNSSTCGLQILQPENEEGLAEWVVVPPQPDALVVNLGDLFCFLSNGRYRSCLHRAVVSQNSHRYSIASFHGPPPHVKVLPLKGLLSLGHGAIFRGVTWTEYLNLKSTHFDKAMTMVMVQKEDRES